MSVAVAGSQSLSGPSHRSWWQKRNQNNTLPKSNSSPSSKFNVLASAFAFASKGNRKQNSASNNGDGIGYQYYQKGTNSFSTVSSTSRQTKTVSSASSFSPDESTSDSLVTSFNANGDAALSTATQPTLPRAASSSLQYIPNNHTLNRGVETRPALTSEPHIRKRVVSEFQRPPIWPIQTNSTAGRSTSLANMGNTPSTQRPRASSASTGVLSRSGSTYSTPESSAGTSQEGLVRRLTQSDYNRLPPVKEPPLARCLPLPPPGLEDQGRAAEKADPPRQLGCSNTSFSPTRVPSLLLTDRSMPARRLKPPSTPPISQHVSNPDIERELAVHLASWRSLSEEEKQRTRAATMSPSQERLASPRSQRSLHAKKSSSSLRPALRHASSFTTPKSQETVSGPASPISAPSQSSLTPVAMSQHSPENRKTTHDNQQLAPELPALSSMDLSTKVEDGRSVFSLPIELPSNPRDKWLSHAGTPDSSSADQRTRSMTYDSDRHILPPEEVMRLMDAPVMERSGSHMSSPGTPLSPDEAGCWPANRDGTTPSSTGSGSQQNGLRTPGRPRLPSRSQSAGCGDFPALRPPPRRRPRTGTAGPASPSQEFLDHASTASPVATSLRSFVSTTSVVRNGDGQGEARLHRTASFLTLDDDFDSKTISNKRVVNWESDSSEEASFFDFGRGVSMDSTDEMLSD